MYCASVCNKSNLLCTRMMLVTADLATVALCTVLSMVHGLFTMPLFLPWILSLTTAIAPRALGKNASLYPKSHNIALCSLQPSISCRYKDSHSYRWKKRSQWACIDVTHLRPNAMLWWTIWARHVPFIHARRRCERNGRCSDGDVLAKGGVEHHGRRHAVVPVRVQQTCTSILAF